MKKLSLRPYHGTVYLCTTFDEWTKYYKRLQRCAYDGYYKPGAKHGGMCSLVEGKHVSDRIYIVWGSEPCYLAHELCHVLFHVFTLIDYDPRKGDGEPFCYMLQQLMIESGVK